MRLPGIVLLALAAAAFSTSPLAQNRGAELDKAVEEARAAHLALQEAEKRRDAGLEPQAGERIGTAAGGATRPTDQYLGRQLQLEHEVELARRRYEAAQKRWNDLK
jgi:hypothetical protein